MVNGGTGLEERFFNQWRKSNDATLSIHVLVSQCTHLCVSHFLLVQNHGGKRNPFLAQCSFKLKYLLLRWTSKNNDLSVMIVKEGWIFQHLFVLWALRHSDLVSTCA